MENFLNEEELEIVREMEKITKKYSLSAEKIMRIAKNGNKFVSRNQYIQIRISDREGDLLDEIRMRESITIRAFWYDRLEKSQDMDLEHSKDFQKHVLKARNVIEPMRRKIRIDFKNEKEYMELTNRAKNLGVSPTILIRYICFYA